MSKESALDLEVVRELCFAFALGAPQSHATRVSGGLQHRMFRLRSSHGAWAIKLLNPNALQRENARDHFSRCENFAQRANAAGLPAVAAREHANGVVFDAFDGAYLVYAWHDGQTLSPRSVGVRRANVTGALLGRLHALAIRYPGQSAPTPQALPLERWRELAGRGIERNASWARDVESALPKLLEANARAQHAGEALQENWINGHGDYDQKNVLWRDEANCDDPLILDWEQSGPYHPAQEVMGAALNWAGQAAGATDWPAFQAFLNGYREHAPLHEAELRLASDGVLGKWLVWLEFNLARTLNASLGADELQTANDCAQHALSVTLELLRDAPERLAWCRK